MDLKQHKRVSLPGELGDFGVDSGGVMGRVSWMGVASEDILEGLVSKSVEGHGAAL